MSHYRLKTTWTEIGPYGRSVKRTLYAHHNLSCDYVVFYDDKGEAMFEFEDTEPDNLLEAMKRLASPWQRNNVLNERVDYMTPDEIAKLR